MEPDEVLAATALAINFISIVRACLRPKQHGMPLGYPSSIRSLHQVTREEFVENTIAHDQHRRTVQVG